MRAGQQSRYGRICDTACRGNLRRGPENPGLRNGRGREITDHIEWNSNNESMLKGEGEKEKWEALLLLIRDLQDDLLNISSYHGMAVWLIFREKSGCQSKETTQSI